MIRKLYFISLYFGSIRLGDQIAKFHMNLLKEQVEAVKQERLRREE